MGHFVRDVTEEINTLGLMRIHGSVGGRKYNIISVTQINILKSIDFIAFGINKQPQNLVDDLILGHLS